MEKLGAEPGQAPAGSAIPPKRTYVEPVADGSQAGGLCVKRTDKAGHGLGTYCGRRVSMRRFNDMPILE